MTATLMVIYFFVYDNAERTDTEMIIAFMIILAVIVVFVAVILFVTHRINKHTYHNSRKEILSD